MLGVGWTEMLVIGVVALIVIGPRELPALMNRMGKVVGSIRRMGADFQRELNRSTGLDQVTDLRRSITEPLKKTTAEIRKEFNAIGKDGTVTPTGVIKPATPGAESVVDEIKAKAGMVAPPEPVKTGPVKAALPPKPATVAAAPPAPPVAKPVQAAPVSPPAPEPVPKTPRKLAAKPKPIESPAPVEAIAPAKPAAKPRRTRTPAATPAAVDEKPEA